MRALLPSGPVDYSAKRVENDIAKRVLDAYEKALAPPAEILARTFGLIWTTRTVLHADSVSYVYERTHDLLGREVCKAFRITEHPLQQAPVRFDPNKAQFPGPLPNATPLIETVEVRCNERGMQAVVPGSLTSPVPRHRP
jgi:hypothetical protein